MFRDANGEPGLWSFWQVTRFENALEFLDSPGEWYLDEDEGWLYYKPQPWREPAHRRCRAAGAAGPREGEGRRKKPIRDVEFRDLTFAYATWLQPSGENGYVSDQGGFRLVGEGHEPNTIGHDPNDVATPGNVSIRFGRNVRFVGNRFVHLGAVGLALATGSKHNLVRGNIFTDIGSSALTLSGISAADHNPATPAQQSVGNTIAANLISEVGWGYPDAPGIYIGFSSGTKVVRNTIEDVPWSGIAVGWGWGLLDPGGFPGLPGATPYQWGVWETPTPNRNGLIAENTIRDFLGQLWDGGAIYTTGAQGTASKTACGSKATSPTASAPRPAATPSTPTAAAAISRSAATCPSTTRSGDRLRPPAHLRRPPALPEAPSEADGLAYGTDTGGCVTYGDIAYIDNSWLQPPMKFEMELATWATPSSQREN